MGRPAESVNLRPCKTADTSGDCRARGRCRPTRYPNTREPDGSGVTSIRKNAQDLARQWHAMLFPFLHTMLGNGPELGLKIDLRPPCLRSLTKANRCEHEEGDRQLEHMRHGRSLKRRERRPNLAVRQARLVLRPGPHPRKPVDNLLGRIVIAVIIADRPAQNVNQLMPHPMTDRPAPRPVRGNDVEAIVDCELVHSLGIKHWKNVCVETSAVPNLRVCSRPVLALVLKDEVNSLPNGRCQRDRSRRRFTRITALASSQSDRVREATRCRQRNERVRTLAQYRCAFHERRSGQTNSGSRMDERRAADSRHQNTDQAQASDTDGRSGDTADGGELDGIDFQSIHSKGTWPDPPRTAAGEPKLTKP